MADVLSAAELAAIAAYKGPVTVLPYRMMSEAAIAYATVGIGWKQRHEADKRRFGRSMAFRALKAREEQPSTPIAVAMAARREEVLRMAWAGRRNTDMAVTLGISLCTLKADIRALKAAGQFPSQDERQAARASA